MVGRLGTCVGALDRFFRGQGFSCPVLSFSGSASWESHFFLEVKTNYRKEMLHSLSSEQSLGFVFICRAGGSSRGHSTRGPGSGWQNVDLVILSKATAIGFSRNPEAPRSNML